MKNVLFFAGILFFTVTFLPLDASAYFMTDERVLKVNETTSIYFIEYSFGHENYEFFMPILATRNQEHNSKLKSIGYEVLKDGKTRTNVGSTQAIVLANETIEDDMYKTRKGFRSPFTLAVILTTPDDAPNEDYAIRVTDLPFYRGNDKEYLKLNPSELQYYITNESSFNESNKTVPSLTISVGDIKYTEVQD